MKALGCRIGLHKRRPDPNRPQGDRYLCRGCDARWIRVWLHLGPHSHYEWERIS